MKTAEFAGAIGIMFGGPQVESLNGDFMGSIAESMDGRRDSGRNRWRPNGHTAATQIDLLRCSGSAPSKELFVVASDHHSRSRYGNQRP